MWWGCPPAHHPLPAPAYRRAWAATLPAAMTAALYNPGVAASHTSHEMPPVSMTPEEMTLDQLAQAIRQIQASIKPWASLDEAIAIGRLLLRASRKLANGGYGRWRMGVGVPPKRANGRTP